MLASKQTDPVVGVDIHWEMVPAPPAPPIPTPIPNPFVGMIFDPLGLAVGVAISQVVGALTGSPPTGAVLVNYLPATNTGTEAMGFGHVLIPPGVSWAPIPAVMPLTPPGGPVPPGNPAMPDDDGIVVTGSKTVKVMGSNFARLGDRVMSCSEPVRLPSSVILAVPKGLPVLVGGPPTMDVLAALGAFIRTQWMSNQLHRLVSRIQNVRLRSLLHRAVCFLTGHPVDVATGRVFTDHVDVELPGPLPLRIERVYNSGFSARAGSLGYGWSHSLEQAVWRERGKVVYRTDDGREVEFDTFDFPDHTIRPGEEVFYPIDRLTLKCKDNNRWEVWNAEGICHELEPVPGGDPDVARLVRMRTRDDHRIELHYDEQARLSWVRDSGGRRILFENDAAGRLTKIKLPVPRGEGHFEHLRYTYDEHGDLVRVTDALGNFWEFEYTSHLLTRETDREKLSFYFGYDGIGQDAWCVRTWGDGGIYDHELVYDKVGRTTCVTNSLGHTTTYRMNEVGCVTEVIDPLGGQTRYEYDGRSLQQTAETDPLGNAIRRSYDDRGNLIRIEKADGAVWTFEYLEHLDSPVKVLDPNGGEWHSDYDELGRLKRRANPFGHLTNYEYEDGRLVRVTTPGGAATSVRYDEAGNVIQVMTASGGEVRFRHDRLGRVTKLVNVRDGVQRREYDAAGNLVRVEEPHGVSRQFSFDREQNLTRATDGRRDIAYTYSGYHRLHERHEAGTTTRFHYDTEDQLVAVENEAGERYEFELDERGQVQTETGFDGFTRRYERDAAGQVTKLIKPSGREAELRYDAVGRLIGVDHSDGSFERYRYRTDGSLVEASNDSAEVHFELDPMGRILRELTRLPDGTEHWVRSSYGPDGHRVRVQTGDGHLHHIERNPAGDVTRVELEGRRWHVDFERDAKGEELTRTFPSGVRSHWQRDAVGRPTRRVVTWRGERTLDERQYQWEGDDQIRTILNPQHGDASYRHDDRGRVVWARLPWGEEQHRGMDAVGNVYRSSDQTDRRYGRGGRIEEADGARYVHDADGNLVETTDVVGDTTKYTWNAAGRLQSVSLPDGREVEFTYDTFARRLSKVVRQPSGPEGAISREVRWAWDGDSPQVELDTALGKSTWVYEPESFNPLAKLAEGRVWGVLNDHLGAPTELIAEDGSPAWRGDRDVFGDASVVRAETPCELRWPGQHFDEDVGLTYNRFRFYDVPLGRYISPDPIRLGGGLSLYGYADDVLTDADPLGLISLGKLEDQELFEHINDVMYRDKRAPGNSGGRHGLTHRIREQIEGSMRPPHPGWSTHEEQILHSQRNLRDALHEWQRRGLPARDRAGRELFPDAWRLATSDPPPPTQRRVPSRCR